VYSAPPAYRKDKDFPFIWEKVGKYYYSNVLETHCSEGPDCHLAETRK